MKLKEFKYQRPKTNETKNRKVWVLESDDIYMSGIDLSTLSEEEEEKVSSLFEEFLTALKPYMKTNWRRFKKENIVPED